MLYKKADVICCVSQEIENRIREEIGKEIPIEKIENCVDEEFFDVYTEKKRETLKSITVVLIISKMILLEWLKF